MGAIPACLTDEIHLTSGDERSRCNARDECQNLRLSRPRMLRYAMIPRNFSVLYRGLLFLRGELTFLYSLRLGVGIKWLGWCRILGY